MANVAVTRKDSILDQIEQTRGRIAQRAYELFRQRDGEPGDPTVDWLTSERELVWKPAVEFREKNGTFTVVAALPDVEAKDLSVDVSAEDVVIKAASTRSCAELFRSVHFPKPVDVAKARAAYRNGLLTVTVPAERPARAKAVGGKAA